jgi:hypothetical protein
MPYDPTKPANNSPIVAAELRDQFAGLNADIMDRATFTDVNDAITAQTSGNCNFLPPPNFIVSDPPTQAEVQAIGDYVYQLYVALSRS